MIFDEYLYKYGLHDCIVDDITIDGQKICFHFNFGVYLLDKSGKETDKTASCIMSIEIADLDINEIWEHVVIYRIFKNKINEIQYKKFVEEVQNFKFNIDINYLSSFCNDILIEGYISKHKYQFRISEIYKIEFLFISHK